MKSAFLFSLILFFGLFFDRMNIFRYCLLSSALHEAGHVLAYAVLQKKMPEIKISPFGFRMKNNVTDKNKLAVILISGPLINLAAFLSGIAFLSIRFTLNAGVFAAVNLIIFTVNMLPVYYLDGGQLLSLIFPRYSAKRELYSLARIRVGFVMLIYFTNIDKVGFTAFIVFFFYFAYNCFLDLGF